MVAEAKVVDTRDFQKANQWYLDRLEAARRGEAAGESATSPEAGERAELQAGLLSGGGGESVKVRLSAGREVEIRQPGAMRWALALRRLVEGRALVLVVLQSWEAWEAQVEQWGELVAAERGGEGFSEAERLVVLGAAVQKGLMEGLAGFEDLSRAEYERGIRGLVGAAEELSGVEGLEAGDSLEDWGVVVAALLTLVEPGRLLRFFRDVGGAAKASVMGSRPSPG